ncbi:SusD/RagB family nutrient-binding outer membrane lipoprotein [Sphingobacterium sp. N143]|uniref:SusD/RagB family nutrient-binding outer membrane lipoprotein n=1 Tax=Sphingobacterium sp. N143 TaxID=2746727 RepID=UPI0025777957|nr:SusD/RagB family nutrient-binding outer membrane lipoprotein [Sphingobacterium sp. N143]MDM1295015.1 SusD/RagB family nutrient-binding outer membrane lipoprotein [Sphingobacterium sp. N143]
MKRYILYMGLCAATLTFANSCSKSSFDENYRDQGKVTETTVEKQFAGMIYSYRQLIVPEYRNLFVTLRPTIFRYLHTTGWINETNQLLPGAAAIEDRWSRYYEGLAQYRELETIYNKSADVEKKENRIYYLTAKVLFYDQTEQTVDLHGAIPWSKAGMLSSNNSDYQNSYPAYDQAEDIYAAMMTDLKSISKELNTITVSSATANRFKTQDIINNGDIVLWKKYCNSLRLRLLTRVSASSKFATQASQEIAEIINNQTSNPLILANADNAQLDIYNLDDNSIQTKNIRDAFEAGGWYANLASKRMVDHMLDKEDPRLPFMFEPGEKAAGKYIGLDQSKASANQTALATGGTLAIYNRSTYSRNQYFPGILFSATETNLLLAEYYNKAGNASAAKTAFENSIKESIDLYRIIRSKSNDNTVAAPKTPTDAAITAYINNLNWAGASNKLELIATQKWIHFNVLQTVQAWSEQRRLDLPKFDFVVQNADIQKTVPVKFNLPPSESVYNSANYNAVKDQDNINTKLFWDVH